MMVFLKHKEVMGQGEEKVGKWAEVVGWRRYKALWVMRRKEQISFMPIMCWTEY